MLHHLIKSYLTTKSATNCFSNTNKVHNLELNCHEVSSILPYFSILYRRQIPHSFFHPYHSIQELEQQLDDLLKCAVCLNAVSAPIYQCSNGHLICRKCIEHIEKLPQKLKKCTTCGVNLNDKRNRNLVAEALLTLFPKNESDEQTTITAKTEESSHGNIDEIITYKIICKELSVYLDQERRKNAMIKLTRNSYVEVISIIDDLDEKLVLGNLKTGGELHIMLHIMRQLTQKMIDRLDYSQ